jgi:hypothetical protein
MHKIIHKLIRYSRDGVNVAADVNAVLATGGRASVRSRSRVVQRNGRTWTESEVEDREAKEVDEQSE